MARDGEDPHFELDLLTPKYEPSHHSLYLTLLRRALKEPNVRNIALTGAFGTGKSSVLTQLMEDTGRRKRTLVISLSSLGVDYSTRQDTGTAEGARTNQIQKEIVKQILYTVHPGRAPRSRFDRTSRGRALDGVVLAVLVGLVAAVAITYGRNLIEGVVHGTANTGLTFALSFLAVASLVYLLRRVMRGRVSLEQLDAGPASISLKSVLTSFFDEFLDEIVYFFEVTKRDLVIFEDIDRFDDAGIFETLRALNTLLNSAPQLRRKPVRFIYAMRDSVFQKLERQLEQQSETDAQSAEVTPAPRPSNRGAAGDVDVARDDVDRANRTKFFDIVIPVVPFITRENARDIMTKEFRKDAMGVSDRLLNIVARHIADMRLVTNIRNEFKVFHHHLIDGPHAVPGLDPDWLLAIVVYKNVHLEDFEKIRLGTSNLDTLYKFGRTVVAGRVRRDTERAGALRSALADQDALTYRAEQLGDRLSVVLQDVGGYMQGPSGRLSAQELRSAQFWQSVAIGAAQYTLHTRNGAMPATKLLLEALVHQPLTPERWDSETRPAIEREIVTLDRAITDAIRADWASLYRAADDKSSEGETFAAATRRLLQSDLAADLVEHGYLDEYFSLYIAPFYGEQISRRARSFIQQHVDRGVPDELYLLDGTDVDAILRDRPHALEDVGIYNVSVLDHLLAHNRLSATTIIGNVPRMGAEQTDLLRMYVEHGAHPTAFVEVLTPIWSAVFTYLAEDAHVDQSRLLLMVDSALRSWATEVDYTLTESVRELLEEHYVLLPSLSGPQSTGRAAQLAVRCGTTFVDLTRVGDRALPTVRDADAYPITAPNLRRVTGLTELSLDRIAAIDSPTIYAYVQARLQDYLDATDDQPSVLEPARFGEILLTLDGQQPELIDRVIARAAAGCVITDITKVPETAWAALASHAKFAPTVANLHAYISARSVDQPLAKLLDVAAPIVAADEQSISLSVQAAVVNARDAIPDPQRRVALADQIPTEEYLDGDQIPREPSNIVSLLLEHNLVEDGPSTFARETFVDGATFAQAVAVSEQFATFITPALIPGDRLADLIGHERVDVAVKTAVLEDLDIYAADAPPAAFRAVAKYARDARIPLSGGQMANLHAGGVDDRAIVALVAQSDLASDDLLQVVRALEGYAEVAQPGRTKVKLPDDHDHWELVRRLEHVGVVSKASSDGKGSIEVWRHHKAR